MKLITAVLATALCAGSAAARVVDYKSINAGNFAAQAAELKIAPVSAPPTRTGRDIAGQIAPGVDHEVLTLGTYCSAYKVENPISSMLVALFAEATRDPATPATAARLTIKVAAARSNQRCVEVKEYNVRCIARVTITGEVEVEGRSAPVSVSVERDSSVGGICGDRARGMGLVSREAGQQFLAAALAAADGAAHP